VKWRRRVRVCRLYMMDMWGELLVKARKNIRLGESETNEVVRLMRWSKQRFMVQRRVKEFYLRMREVRRKQNLRGGRLRVKFKIKRYYGGMSQVEYEGILEKARKIKRSRRVRLRLIDIFVGLFEKRVDVILFRMNVVNSVEEGQKCVREGKVLVNGRCVKNYKVILKLGDVVGLRDNLKRRFRCRFMSKMREGGIVASYPRYLEVSYRSMSCVLWKEPCVREVPFVGKMDIRDVEGAIV
jgi:ribosomal protein S4